MQSPRYQQLSPLALAVAAGCTSLIFALLVGFPMAGMMGGYGYGYGYGHMMWGGFGPGFGFGFLSLIGVVLVAAVAGAVFAWIYNAVNGFSRTVEGSETSSTPGPRISGSPTR